MRPKTFALGPLRVFIGPAMAVRPLVRFGRYGPPGRFAIGGVLVAGLRLYVDVRLRRYTDTGFRPARSINIEASRVEADGTVTRAKAVGR